MGSGLSRDPHVPHGEELLRVSKVRALLSEGAVWAISPWQAPDRI